MKKRTIVAIGGLTLALTTACGSSNDSGFHASPIGDASIGGGGASNGGASNGGASNGGASNGGASNGGASNGGASNGGASNGGAGDVDASTAGDASTGGSGGDVDAAGTDAAFVDGGSLGPTVTILHPGAGVDRTVNVSIYFHATATDPTDGTLTGSALVWTDSLEGQFGTGDPVNWAPTVTGTHTITVRAVDSLGYGATASITFDIVP